MNAVLICEGVYSKFGWGQAGGGRLYVNSICRDVPANELSRCYDRRLHKSRGKAKDRAGPKPARSS